ncbi:Hemocyte protein-glutamine gamma-glutamyltransferase [Blattella germanica]|nr:Hemocyte protein-glutamine gamma-glutamyltransferase [Blattella germanica]
MTTVSVYYRGNRAHVIKEASGDIELAPKEKKTMTLEVTPEEYVDKLVEYYNMRVYAVATVLQVRNE